MAITTVDQVKAALKITDSSSDDQIELLIPMIQADIVEKCHYAFLDELGAEEWPLGLVLVSIQMVGWKMNNLSAGSGIQSESQGGHSVTYESAGQGGYPASIENALKPYVYARGKFSQITLSYDEKRGRYGAGNLPGQPNWPGKGVPNLYIKVTEQ